MNPDAGDAYITEHLYGLPCWHVKQGHGSFLTLEFGTPHQRIREVLHVPGSRFFHHPSRGVFIRGAWHLWIYRCAWRIRRGTEELAHSESPADIVGEACRALDGQKLIRFEYCTEKGASRFRFDLGGVLSTWPSGPELEDQWMLYEGDHFAFAYRSDGKFRDRAEGGQPESDPSADASGQATRRE